MKTTQHPRLETFTQACYAALRLGSSPRQNSYIIARRDNNLLIIGASNDAHVVTKIRDDGADFALALRHDDMMYLADLDREDVEMVTITIDRSRLMVMNGPTSIMTRGGEPVALPECAFPYRYEPDASQTIEASALSIVAPVVATTGDRILPCVSSDGQFFVHQNIVRDDTLVAVRTVVVFGGHHDEKS